MLKNSVWPENYFRKPTNPEHSLQGISEEESGEGASPYPKKVVYTYASKKLALEVPSRSRQKSYTSNDLDNVSGNEEESSSSSSPLSLEGSKFERTNKERRVSVHIFKNGNN